MKNFIFLMFALPLWGILAQTSSPVVHARVYWMQGCPHCDYVIQNVLPPLQNQYGDGLALEMVELVSLEDVDRFYSLAAALGVPKEKTGVPLIMIGDQVLVGQDEIVEKFSALVADYAALGGVAAAPTPVITPGGSGSALTPAAADPGLCRPETPCDPQPIPYPWLVGAGAAFFMLAIAVTIILRRAQTTRS